MRPRPARLLLIVEHNERAPDLLQVVAHRKSGLPAADDHDVGRVEGRQSASVLFGHPAVADAVSP